MEAISSDKIIYRIPVILNNPIDKKFVLLKYPLRDKSRPYHADKDLNRSNSISFKPKSNHIEFSYGVDSDSPHFSNENSHPAKSFKFKSRLIPNRCNYAFFQIKDGKLYLTPLGSTYQMLPDFSHINDAVSEPPANEGKTPIPPANGAEKMTAVVQKLHKVEKNNNLAKFLDFVSRINELNSEKGVVLAQKPFSLAPPDSQKFLRSVISGENFLDFLREETEDIFNKQVRNFNLLETCSAKKNLSNKCIREELPNWDQKVLAALKNTGTTHLNELFEILREDIANPSELVLRPLLSALERMGLLIRGVWTAKSAFLLEGRERFARDYLLGLFWDRKDGKVSRKDWESVAKIPFDVSDRILNDIATLNREQRLWELKKSKATHRSDLLPENLKASMEKQIERIYVSSFRVLTNGEPIDRFVTEEKAENAKEQLAIFLEELFKKYGVCTLSFVERNLIKNIRDLGPISDLAFASHGLMAQELNSFCTAFECGVFIQKSTGNPLYDHNRHSVAEYLIERKTASKNDILDHLKSRGNKKTPAGVVGILSELCTVAANKEYKLKPGEYDK